MSRLQVGNVEPDEQLLPRWVEKDKLWEPARKRRWRIIGGVVGGALLSVIGLVGWTGRS